jgi:uncharacterized delta-60 repeat protein
MNTRINQATGFTMQTCKKFLSVFGVCAAIASAVSVMPVSAQAATGDVDPSFGINGRVISRINSNATDELVNDAVLQPDGKIVTVGTCKSSASTTRFCITRHTIGGALDTTFGDLNSGTTSVLVSADENYATAVGLQSNGKITVGGYCGVSNTTINTAPSYDECLVRLLPNGKLDPSFGVGGVVRRVRAGDSIINTMLVYPDGSIAVGGSSTFLGATKALVVFFGPDGAEEGLGTVGEFGTGPRSVQSIALSPRGSVMFAGGAIGAADLDFFFGIVDQVFFFTSIASVSFGDNDFAQTIVPMPNEHRAVAGFCKTGNTFVFCATRFSRSSNPDATFGTGGKVLLPALGVGDSYAYSALAQPDGKLVLAGQCTSANPSRFCLARLNHDGSLDKTFGANGAGYSLGTAGNGDIGRKVMIRPNGALVIAGTCSDGARRSFCLEQYQNAPSGGRYCSLDIDGDGQVLPTTDLLIMNRIAAGMTGPQVIAGTGIAGKPRGTWAQVREYLIGQCGMSIAQ